MYTYHITAKFENGKQNTYKFEAEKQQCPLELAKYIKFRKNTKTAIQIDIVTILQEN